MVFPSRRALLGISCLLLGWLPTALPGAGRGGGGGRKKASVPPFCPNPSCQCRRVEGEVILRCFRTSGVLPDFELQDNSTYRLVEIIDQNLTEIPDGGFANVPTRTLDLSGNQFSQGLLPGAFEGQGDSLKTLILSDSSLPEVPKLLYLNTLGILKLDGNNISVIPKRAFSDAENLKELHLYRNVIIRIEASAFTGLLRLEDLKLFRNQLTEIPKKLFRGLRTLSNLDISQNKITSILPGTFKGLSSLKWLSMESNLLTKLSKKVFTGLKRLKYLKLEDNPLVEIGGGTFGAMRKLNYLSIDIAQVTNLHENTFKGLTKLKNLNLGEVNRTYLMDGLFSSMGNLQYLSIFDYEKRLTNLSSSVFSSKLKYGSLKVSLVPVYDCQCDLPWISDLTQKGAYIIGYCGSGQPVSCVRRQRTNSRQENTDRRRLKRKKGRKTSTNTGQ